MRLKLIVAIALAGISVAGCATKQVKLSESKEAPKERVFALDPSGTDAGRITFIRDKGVLAGSCHIDIYVDKKKVAILDQGERASIDIGVGKHTVYGTASGWALCRGDEDNKRLSRSSQLIVEKGDDQIWRVSVDTNMIISVNPQID